jgi:hypothetical protein
VPLANQNAQKASQRRKSKAVQLKSDPQRNVESDLGFENAVRFALFSCAQVVLVTLWHLLHPGKPLIKP